MSRQDVDNNMDGSVNIQVAAKALGVSTKTVQRYIEKGLLTKIKDGHKVSIPIEEIKDLRERIQTDNGQAEKDTDKKSITIDLDKYDQIMTEIGELRHKSQLLITYLSEIKTKEERIIEKEKEISELESKNRQLETQLKSLENKLIPWWKKIFKRSDINTENLLPSETKADS